MADDDDLNPHEWEKPAWAKDGPKLKSTGKGAKKACWKLKIYDFFHLLFLPEKRKILF